MSLRIMKLSKYGAVKTCKVVTEKVVTIVITDGFKCSSNNVFKFLEECTQLFPEHPMMETCITDDNLAILVLTKS